MKTQTLGEQYTLDVSGGARVWQYLRAYDEVYASQGTAATDVVVVGPNYGGTVVATPSFAFTCDYDDVLGVFSKVAEGGFVSRCTLTVGRSEWKPASLWADLSHGATSDSLLDRLLRRLTGAEGSRAMQEDEDIVVLPRRREAPLFSAAITVKPNELPRRRVSYIGEIEDVGDD